MLKYFPKQKNPWKKASRILLLLFVVAGIALGYYWVRNARQIAEDKIQKQLAIEKAKSTENVFVGDSVVEEKKAEVTQLPTFVPRSENFQMREAIFGSYEPTTGGEVKSTPLKISDVRSEVLVSKDGKEAKLYIAWKTNKLAVSQILYSKNATQPNLLSEDGLSLSHALILGKFDFDTRYTYYVKAKDRWGNEIRSAEFSIYSGQKADSVFFLIANEFKKIFKWTGA